MFELIKLTANKASFHAITFHKGVNIVLGKQKNIDALHKKSTTNGIGKSLIIKIIDFCLASEKNKNWLVPLAGWEFTLTINVKNSHHTLTRTIDKQNFIILDGQEKKIKEVRETLKEYAGINGIFSFRQIINRFLRKGKPAYNNYLITIDGEKECNTYMVLCYLLGLDYSLCQEKIEQKQYLDSNLSLLNKSKNDVSFQQLFGIGQYDIALELSNIDFEIAKLENEIQNKNYAENYADIQKKADAISADLDKLNNRRFVILNNIESIKKSLSIDISIDLDSVKNVYNELGIILPDQLTRSLQEVEHFHYALLTKRKETLSKDFVALQTEIKEVEQRISILNQQFDETIEFLRIHSAMDKYVTAIRQIDLLKAKRKELERVANIEKEIKTKIEKIKKEIADSNIKAQAYLDSVNHTCDLINRKFSLLARTFYENKKSALSIKCNDGDNQIRYNIEARITSDGSDGIQEIITFCFDWVLLQQKITNLGFIYHDSLLVANVEQRQKEILFQIIKDLCGEQYQYIININADQMANFSTETTAFIQDNTILELTDDNTESKLLGIEVDLGREFE